MANHNGPPKTDRRHCTLRRDEHRKLEDLILKHPIGDLNRDAYLKFLIGAMGRPLSLQNVVAACEVVGKPLPKLHGGGLTRSLNNQLQWVHTQLANLKIRVSYLEDKLGERAPVIDQPLPEQLSPDHP